jgi:leucyl aminopeptidase
MDPIVIPVTMYWIHVDISGAWFPSSPAYAPSAQQALGIPTPT